MICSQTLPLLSFIILFCLTSSSSSPSPPPPLPFPSSCPSSLPCSLGLVVTWSTVNQCLFIIISIYRQSRQSSPDRERHLNKAERKERRSAMESEEERRERKGDRKRVSIQTIYDVLVHIFWRSFSNFYCVCQNHLTEELASDLKRRKEDEKSKNRPSRSFSFTAIPIHFHLLLQRDPHVIRTEVRAM